MVPQFTGLLAPKGPRCAEPHEVLGKYNYWWSRTRWYQSLSGNEFRKWRIVDLQEFLCLRLSCPMSFWTFESSPSSRLCCFGPVNCRSIIPQCMQRSVSRWTKAAGFHVLTYQAYWRQFNAGPISNSPPSSGWLIFRNMCSIPQKIYKSKFWILSSPFRVQMNVWYWGHQKPVPLFGIHRPSQPHLRTTNHGVAS